MKTTRFLTAIAISAALSGCSSSESANSWQFNLSNPSAGSSLPQLVYFAAPSDLAMAGNLQTDRGMPVEIQQNGQGELRLAVIAAIEPGEKQLIKVVKSDRKHADMAYAELSVRQGGQWQDTVYKADGFKFKNVEEFTAPEQLTDHSYYLRYEGPGWENDQIGYRLYLDWRNGIDVFAKTGTDIVLPNVGQDGYDSYHEMADWGVDILKVGKSLGLGALGRLDEGTVMHFQDVVNTSWKILADNHLSASFVVNYEAWNVADKSVDVLTEYTIVAKDPATQIEVSLSEPIDNLVTGLVKHANTTFFTHRGERWGVIGSYGKQSILSDQDELGMAILFKLEQVERQFEGPHDYLLQFKPLSHLTYQILAVWPSHPDSPKDQTGFEAYLKQKISALDHPLRAL